MSQPKGGFGSLIAEDPGIPDLATDRGFVPGVSSTQDREFRPMREVKVSSSEKKELQTSSGSEKN